MAISLPCMCAASFSNLQYLIIRYCTQEKKRINKEGELVVTSTATRSQA